MKGFYSEIIIFMVGVFVGISGYYLYKIINDDPIFVMISENTKCNVINYSVLLNEKIVSIPAEKIRSHKYKDENINEGEIQFISLRNKDGYIKYRIKATYEDCNEVVGPLNTVEPGWIIYETIKNDKVVHDVRAK